MENMENMKKINITDVKTLSDNEKSKRIRGVVATTVNKKDGSSTTTTNNLVLLGGREFLAQKLSDTISSINSKELNTNTILKNFKIRYFGVGSGGATQTGFSTKIGPYENDVDLNQAVQFSGVASVEDNYKYIKDGFMKRIQSDGSIEILDENHSISVDGEEVDLQANTTIKFTLKIQAGEMIVRPFCFNEAALYAVNMEDSSEDILFGETTTDKLSPEFITFARFTTLNKYLESSDTLLIEWYILV